MNVLLILISIITGVLTLKSLVDFVRARKVKFLAAFLIWIGVTVVAIHPPFVYVINEWFGLGANLNSIIFVALVFLYMFVFSILRNQEKIKRDISKTVRHMALSEYSHMKAQSGGVLATKDAIEHVSEK